MATHRVVTNPGIYYLTFTCCNWLPLIEMVNGYDLVYKWFDVLSEKGQAINAYVIMPNHVHLISFADESPLKGSLEYSLINFYESLQLE